MRREIGSNRAPNARFLLDPDNLQLNFCCFFLAQGRVVRKPINANLWLKVYRGFHLAL